MAARDNSGSDKRQAELLRRALASSAEVVEACPDAEILAAYADGALDADETARYELHFSQCPHCREQLAAMSRAAVASDIAPAPRLGWIWTWGWIALAPVTAMLLIAAILIARHPAANRAAEQPLVAMQAPQQGPAPSAVPMDSGEPSKELPAAPPEKPAEPAAASRVHSENGSVAASVPPPAPAPAKVGNDREIAARAREEKEISRASESDFAAGVRKDAQLGKSADASDSAAPYRQNDAARAQNETVTVESEVSPLAAPAPSQSAKGGAAGSLSAGNAGQPPGAAAKKSSSTVTMSVPSNLVSSNMVSIETAADRDARTIVRSPDPQVLWRISGGRYVERSGDAGATWRTQWTNANAEVIAGSAPSVDTCWLVGRGGIVLVTKDGKKWRAVEPPANEDFVGVAATDSSSATITATDGHKFETRDGGKHWLPAP